MKMNQKRTNIFDLHLFLARLRYVWALTKLVPKNIAFSMFRWMCAHSERTFFICGLLS
jgi:hypothetical protein